MRRKYQLTRNRVQVHNRIEALLEEAHLKLSSLVSDLLGLSARRMLKAVAEGETDPVALAPAPRCIVANLPYNIAVPLLIGWLRRAAEFEGLTLMFQKEVAGRLTAAPGGKDYGRLSVLVQRLCEARVLFNVDKRAFTPPPKVTSSVVSLIPRPTPLAAADWESLEAVTAAAFGQRRKMLRSSLKPLGLDLDALSIDARARAEELDVETFCRLARAYEAIGPRRR